jgi:hypothetical protein
VTVSSSTPEQPDQPGPAGLHLLGRRQLRHRHRPRAEPEQPVRGSTGDYALIKYRFSDLPASARYTNRMFRMVGGVKGSAMDWDYQANVVIAHDTLESAQTGFLSYKQLMSDIKTGAYNFVDPSKNSQAVRAPCRRSWPRPRPPTWTR